MSELPQGMSSTERFRSRIIPMLRGDCGGCFVRSRLGLTAELENGTQFEGREAIKRLGGLVGGAIELLDLSDCDRRDCLSEEKKLELALALRGGVLSPDEACGEEAVRIAVSMNLLPPESDQ